MKLSNEAKVALTIVSALIFAFLGWRVMKDMPLFRQSQMVYTYFGRVDGLSAGNYAFLNGVKIGSVKKIELTSGDSVRVTLNFDLDVNMPVNSTAYLESSGLLDEKTIVIEKGDSDKMVKYGGTIKGVYRGGMLEKFKDEGEKLSSDVSESFDQLNRLLERLNGVVTEKNQAKIGEVLSNLKTATNEAAVLLQHKRSKLEQSIEHASNFMANLDTVSTRNKSRVDSVLVGLQQSMDQLSRLSGDLQMTSRNLNSILDKINKGQGSLGKLVNDDSLYNNLNGFSAEMKALIKNINENPGKYLKHMHLIDVF